MSWNFLNFITSNILTIGTATVDIFVKAESEISANKKFKSGSGLCFPLGGKVEIKNSSVLTGGGATNAAVSFSRLGFKTSSYFRIGRDLFGQIILKDLEKENVIVYPETSAKAKTDYSIILVAENGDRSILVNRGLDPLAFSKKSLEGNGLHPAWVYVTPGNIPFPAVLSMVSFLKSKGSKIALNPSKNLLKLGEKKLKPLLEKTNVVILNREEAAFLTGEKFNNERAIFKKFDKLVEGIAVMTDGEKGVLVSDGFRLWRSGIFKNKKIIDRTGAGDAFGAGFVAGLLKSNEFCQKGICGRENINYAIRLGSANATSVVESLGAKPGLLSMKEFNSPRFKNLKITVKKL